MSGRVLLVEDDPVLVRYLAAELTREGYDVEVLTDGDRALDRASQSRPDLVLLDLGTGGVEVLRLLRANPPTSSLPVVLLGETAGGQAAATGLNAGADDYLAKPFDTLELVARVGSTLRRTADVRALSPLTGLPGNHRIEVELATRSAAATPYAICHFDLDEFKGYNDAYGFQRGDELLLLLAACLQRAVLLSEGPPAFLGHVGGDDFVVVSTPAQAEPLCHAALDEFALASLSRYDPQDLERGWLDVIDRRGARRQQPLVTVSVGVASDPGGDQDFRAVVAAATDMKRVAKSTAGSVVAVDRRSHEASRSSR